MWIIRFHVLETKHYNKIDRIFKKYGFSPRKVSSIVFAKALLLHHTQKISLRALGRQFSVDHAALSRCNNLPGKSVMLRELFHVFLKAKVSLYVEDTRSINISHIHNSEAIYHLTQDAFEDILKRI